MYWRSSNCPVHCLRACVWVTCACASFVLHTPALKLRDHTTVTAGVRNCMRLFRVTTPAGGRNTNPFR